MIEKLEAVSRGDVSRLIVAMPPGAAKSTYASVLFPAHFLANHPTASVIAASHTTELAEKWGRRVRDLIVEHGPTLGISLHRRFHPAGATVKQLSLTVGEVNASLDRTLPTIDNAMRLRHISLDLSRLDGLLEVYYKRAVEKADSQGSQAALACVKIMERKAALLGLDSPQKFDVVQIHAEQHEPHEFDRVYDAIMRVARGPSAPNGNGSPSDE